jgi:hypothetical protein
MVCDMHQTCGAQMHLAIHPGYLEVGRRYALNDRQYIRCEYRAAYALRLRELRDVILLQAPPLYVVLCMISMMLRSTFLILWLTYKS